LVRKLCADCRKPYQLDEKQLVSLGKNYDIDALFVTMQKNPEISKIIGSAKSLQEATFYSIGGCDQCGGEGYRGRLGIYEALEMETNIRKLVTHSATSEEIETVARKENGMYTMVEDGFLKAVQGMTTLEEIMRVTKE
jgi:type II secretory ATPase GspE/PulE/Tfp pilus assembly ATPase PilB-like protein